MVATNTRTAKLARKRKPVRPFSRRMREIHAAESKACGNCGENGFLALGGIINARD
jgi:hypothetical protein